jgi:hypothetical protein
VVPREPYVETLEGQIGDISLVAEARLNAHHFVERSISWCSEPLTC